MMCRRCAGLVLVFAMTVSGAAGAQGTNGDVWRTFAQRLDAGAEVKVRLKNGQHFEATLLDARDDALLLQPRTRRPVPVQPVSYDAVVSLERHERDGVGAAKAAAIGVAAGVGAFLAVLGIVMATVD